ncbi:MAG: helicase SNF2 [Azospirillum sp.]|nr:helicase SNF2 [Azospirillum sp.]
MMFSEQDIARFYSYHELEKGRAYLRQGRVIAATLSADGTQASGRVKGTQPRPYEVKVDIHYRRQRDGRTSPTFSGRCSCPLGGFCKHTVAVLLHGLITAPRAVAPPTAAPTPQPVDDFAPLQSWLGLLDRAATGTSPDTYPDDVRHRALYIMSVEQTGDAPVQAIIAPRMVQLRGNGSLSGHVAVIRASSLLGTAAPKYHRETDKVILGLLWAAHLAATANRIVDPGQYPLSGVLAEQILSLVLATGRAHWREVAGPQLHAGAPRTGHAGWDAAEDGTQRFRIGLDLPGGVVLPLPKPWYLDPESGACGPLALDLPPALVPALLAAPPVPAAAAARLRRALDAKLPGRSELMPQVFGTTEVHDAAPVPCLRLTRRSYRELLGALSARDRGFEDDDIDDHAAMDTDLHGALSFDYGGVVIEPGDPRRELTVTGGNTLVVMPRREADEQTAVEQLEEAGLTPVHEIDLRRGPATASLQSGYVLLPDADDPHWIGGGWNGLLAFLHHRVPALRAQGWRISIDEAIAWEVTQPDDDAWIAEVAEGSSGIDWFGVSLGVTVGAERVDLLPLLVPLLRALPEDGDLGPLEELAEADGTLFAPLGDKRVLPLPVARIKPLLLALYELYRVGGIGDDGSISLTAARAAELIEIAAAAAAAGLRWLGGERLLETGRRLKDFSGVAAVAPPVGLSGTLRRYQQDGLNWLQFLRAFDFGGILADDMGLGKTVQALSHLLIEKESGRLDRPALVVAPTSLMTNWRMEAARFTPSLRVLTLHGAARKANFDRIAEFDLVLTTYPLLPRDKAALLGRDWRLLILDEAQVIKNPKAQAALIAQQIKARHRLCLTGTPMENNLGELWSLFHFLMPGLLGDQRQFQRLFRVPIEKNGDARRQRDLARRIRPFLLRRTKQEVAGELPPKTEIIEHIELEGGQRDLYESIRLAMDAKVRDEIKRKGLARSHIIILEALLKLRQVCCDPRLVKLAAAEKVKQSAKLSRLMDMVSELVAEGRRILLFSQFTTMLGLIEAELGSAGIAHVKLTGQTRDRQTPVERFQSGTVPVFLISLKAGGTGLNLTAADTVIHYDPWWNPAVERQATDRAHRIGQDKPVFVYKLVTAGTVETAILDLQARKQALADGLYDPETNQGVKLTEDDLKALFSPLG